MDLISIDEAGRLESLEATIERGMHTFVDVGTALLEIRDTRLYRTTHSTFEEYCRERWGFTRMHASRMIAAAEVVENVTDRLQIAPPSNIEQTRPLASLGPEQQVEAWQRAVETAPDGRVTAAHVQAVVDDFKPPAHVSHNSGNNEWYTPAAYIDAARNVMGGIDCDPASSAKANETVKASVFYTAEDDGLEYEWHGRVWMNPPYAQPLVAQFCESLVSQYEHTVTEACVLVNNATDTGWFHRLLGIAAAVCFPRGRIRFIDAEGNASGAPLQGQSIVYCGPSAVAFGEWFGRFGVVLYP
jgi:ParB family chromosome partitioning protein